MKEALQELAGLNAVTAGLKEEFYADPNNERWLEIFVDKRAAENGGHVGLDHFVFVLLLGIRIGQLMIEKGHANA